VEATGGQARAVGHEADRAGLGLAVVEAPVLEPAGPILRRVAALEADPRLLEDPGVGVQQVDAVALAVGAPERAAAEQRLLLVGEHLVEGETGRPEERMGRAAGVGPAGAVGVGQQVVAGIGVEGHGRQDHASRQDRRDPEGGRVPARQADGQGRGDRGIALGGGAGHPHGHGRGRRQHVDVAVEHALAAGREVEGVEADAGGADHREELHVAAVVAQQVAAVLGHHDRPGGAAVRVDVGLDRQAGRLVAGDARAPGERADRAARLGVHAALEDHDLMDVRQVLVAVEVGELEAEAAHAPLDPGAELDALLEVLPGMVGAVLAGEREARQAVQPQREGLVAGHQGGEGLAAAADIGGLEAVEVGGHLDAHVLGGADVVEGPDAADRPQRDARLLEARQRRQREVLRVELVGGAEQLGLAPHDALTAGAQPQPAVEELHVDVGFLELLLPALAVAAVPGQLALLEVLARVVEPALVARPALEARARVEDALRAEAPAAAHALRHLGGHAGRQLGAAAESRDRADVVGEERVRLAAQRADVVGFAARVDRADDLEADAVLAARHVADAELAVELLREIEVRRVVAAALEGRVGAAHHEQAAEARDLVDQGGPAAVAIRLEGDHGARQRLAVLGDAAVQPRQRPHAGVAVGVVAAVEGAAVDAADEGGAGDAAAPAAGAVVRQVLDLVPPGVGGREHAARPVPHAVVAGLEPDEGREHVEGAPAVGREVVLRLDVEHVVPLREVEVLGDVEVVRDQADLLLEEAVDLQAAVEVLEGARRRGEAEHDARRQPRAHPTCEPTRTKPAHPGHHPSMATQAPCPFLRALRRRARRGAESLRPTRRPTGPGVTGPIAAARTLSPIPLWESERAPRSLRPATDR
jgi:hypothetical protein